MQSELKQIESIVFGISSPEEIVKNSVCKITTNKLYGEGSVYDERMGTLGSDKKCLSCNQECKICPGHPGYIELNVPIIHPLYYRNVISFLKCFCFKCYKFVLGKEHLLEMETILKYKKEARFNLILDKIEKVESCAHCKSTRPKITFSISEGTIDITYKKEKFTIFDEEVKKIFDNISDEDVELLGFNPQLIHPRNLILSNFPVLPPISRPYIVTEGAMQDDDLTVQYTEIVKINNRLLEASAGEKDESKIEIKKAKLIQHLKFRIKTLMNNSQGRAKHTNGRPLKAMKERLSGKDGLIRNNLMGKRTNQSGRTVIGPDPTVRTDELVVPEKIAHTLTVPETVCEYNIHDLQKLVDSHKANYVLRNSGKTRINLKYAMLKKGTELKKGDVILRDNERISVDENLVVLKQGDSIIRSGKIIPIEPNSSRVFSLQVGDIVERQLKNGDIVLLNRQPTLHKGSMLAKRVIIRPFKTFRFSLASTKTFNADYDGDEMNIHVPQNYDARAELQTLSTTKANIMSSQASKSNICIVQDGLLGAYLLTKKRERIPKERFNNLLMKGDNWSQDFIERKTCHIKLTLVELGRDPEELYTGKGLVSMMLPDDFFFVKKTEADRLEPFVRVHKGVMYEGVLNKSLLGSSHNSLIQILHKEYSPEVCIDFVNNIQFIAIEWLTCYSFSIGLGDCKPKHTEKISDNTLKSFVEAKRVEETTHHPKIKEIRVSSALSKAKDVGMRIAKESFNEDNGFISTVTSGSKGDYFNICQITGIIGQQHLTGNRISPLLNRGKRSLPHYPFQDLDIEEEFESRGFVKNSFIKGISPQEFWFHATSGRESLSDTAMKTASSGYVQRRMVKILEDVQVKYDGTVRNSSNSVIQWSYGETGTDRSKTVVLGGKSEILDVSRLAERINQKKIGQGV
jgi:DNA-directed RNA polymerase beta' subunit